MRRFVCLLVGVLLVIPAIGSDSPKGDDGRDGTEHRREVWAL